MTDLELALKKMAETIPNNEDQTTVGMNNVYPNPTNRSSGDISAPWGENPPKDPIQHGSAIGIEFHQGREKLLDRVFDRMPQASAADKALIAQTFEHGKPGEHESHSPLLTRKTADKHAPEAPTLVERVRALTGRR